MGQQTSRGYKLDQTGQETQDLLDKIEGVEAHAQVNIIESVKVNGTAMTPDANKAVDVEVPTALSELSDDATHRLVTDAEKDSWNDKQAAINRVNVTVSSGSGTPSGTASMSGNTLNLSFTNLKGETGATGPQGPAGSDADVTAENITAALGYTPASSSALAGKQDTISDLSAIRSGAALGSTSVQPVDIENMVEAKPIGSIIPPVNPSEFATKEEVSQLAQEVNKKIYLSTDSPYIDDIAEFYTPNVLSGVSECNLRQYNSKAILYAFNGGSTVFTSRLEVNGKTKNGVPYAMQIDTTNDSTNYPVGKIIAYVVFKNIAHFIATSYGTNVGNRLNLSIAPCLELFPIVANGILEKSQELIIFPNIFQSESEIYNDCIKELYFFGKNPSSISCKCYTTSSMIFRGFNPSNAFTCNLNISNAQNGEVYPLVITSTNDEFSYPLNALVGYIIFSDIDTFKANLSGTDNHYLSYKRINSISYNPDILTYIEKKNLNIPPIYIDSSDIYNKCIQEVFFTKNPTETISCRCWTVDTMIFRGKNTGTVFTCSLGITNAQNGTIYPLVITATEDGVNYPLNEVAGYIIFKDIVTFKANLSMADNRFLDLDRLVDFDYNHEIVSYLLVNGSKPTFFDGVKINLPSEILATEGDRLEIFWRNCVTCFNPDCFAIDGVCSVGKSYPRYFQLDATNAMAGNSYTLTVYVRDNDGNTIQSGTTTIKVIAIASQPVSQKNILVVGASATANGNISYELNRRLTTNTGDGTPYLPTGLNFANIAFVGSKTTAQGIKQEATPGWAWKDYCSETGPNSVPNPFWNNGAVDFLNYATLYCNGQIDVLVTHLGANDIFSGRGVATTIAYMEEFINAFHTAFPSAKVIISTIPLPDFRGGMGASYGASFGNSYWTKAKQFWEFADAFNDFCNSASYSSFVSLAPALHTFDTASLYLVTQAPCCNRVQETEPLGTNGIHPGAAGGYTVADSIYQAMMHIL